MIRLSSRWKGLLALIILCMGLYFGLRPTPPEPLYGPYPVERVVDGDTIIVSVEGKRTRIRLIGVDAPESASPQQEKNSPEGEAASQWMKELLNGQQVYLEYDREPQDKYGRTLAYVYLEDGQTMVERLLLEAGLAKAMCIPPNDRYYEEFKKLQKTAG